MAAKKPVPANNNSPVPPASPTPPANADHPQDGHTAAPERWIKIVGLVAYAVTGLFIASLVMMSTMGYLVPASSRWLIAIFVGLGMAVGSGFTGGYALLSGGLHIPGLEGAKPINIAVGGSIAVWVIVTLICYWILPPATGEPYRVHSMVDTVNFQNWKPYSNDNEKTSEVTREIYAEIYQEGQLDYVDETGTTNENLGLECEYTILDVTKQCPEIVPSDKPPRRMYRIQAQASAFVPKNGTKTASMTYKIKYWNNFRIADPISDCKNRCDVTRVFPYPTDDYQIRLLLPRPLKEGKVVVHSPGHEQLPEPLLVDPNSLKIQYNVKNLPAGSWVSVYIQIVP